MRFHATISSAIGIAVAGMLFTGCSSMGSQVAPQSSVPNREASTARFAQPIGQRLSVVERVLGHALPKASAQHPRWMKLAQNGSSADAATTPGVYVVPSFASPSAINEYARKNRSNGGPFCSVNGVAFVNGIGVDAGGNLWAPQSGSNPNIVQEFGPNCGGPGSALIDAAGDPSGIAFDSKGTAYVANFDDFGSLPGDVQVYANGSTNPTSVLSDPSIYAVFEVAVDANGNVFASIINASFGFGIIEFPAGAMPGTLLNVTGFTIAGGLAFDSASNLLVADFGSSPGDIAIYAPPYNGSPTKIMPLQGPSAYCSFGHHGKHLFCGNLANASIDVYGYPNEKYLYSYTNGIQGNLTGVASAPAAPN